MSSMKINYNVSAMVANNSLKINDNKLTAALERLSSGYKINSAKDDAAGLAIARRMHAQIRGLDVATQDAKDGISVVEIADGALAEVQDMLQRMNELAVKSANGTMSDEDRGVLQNEVDQLKEEITRVGQTTEFNSQKLFDGSFDYKGYTNNNNIKVNYYSDEVTHGEYTLKFTVIKKEGEDASFPTDIFDEDGNITKDLYYKAASKIEELYDADGNKIEKYEDLFNEDNELKKLYDKNGDSIGRIYTTGLPTASIEDKQNGTIVDENGMIIKNIFYQEDGKTLIDNATITDTTKLYDTNGNEYKHIYKVDDRSVVCFQKDDIINPTVLADNGEIVAGVTATLQLEGKEEQKVSIEQKGEQTVITGKDGLEIRLDLNKDWGPAGGVGTSTVTMELKGIGGMTLQIGANEGQTIDLRIPELSLLNAGIDTLDLSTADKALKGIDKIDSAIKYVSEMRSRLGAYQNRLEHTQSNLSASSENVTSAYSRIMDTDMATEMTEYTNLQVVSQAATSILAQANERPSQMLQLLQ